ncbi:MAG: endonuclease NucS [Deltaproteobacteria bacterium]|nr:endonuclease NucS [Deltaproteobacteria bacterium]
MSTTHVFIVDTNTFKYHLEYLFAGTGAKDIVVDFNNNTNTKLNHTTENNLVGMIADSQRIRKGDYIVFYLQQNYSENVLEGKFYGIFKAKEDLSFLENNDSGQFLKKQLNKSLTFRTLIEPFEVYSKGVTEWEALDEIKYIQSPCQMLWSLIYRKLKGNRGNTMITIYESERLFKLLRDKNNFQILSGHNFTFDVNSQEIKQINTFNNYTGRRQDINILPRLINKYKSNKSYESHLQAYIVQNIGRDTNKTLDKSLLNGLSIEWIGNEVSCGVGMQRIDIMLSLLNGDHRKIIMPVELKSKEANNKNVIQIQRYVDWLEQYYIPNRISDIQPVLISKKITNKNAKNYKEITESFKQFNNRNTRCMPIKYVEFEVIRNSLNFKKISY